MLLTDFLEDEEECTTMPQDFPHLHGAYFSKPMVEKPESLKTNDYVYEDATFYYSYGIKDGKVWADRESRRKRNKLIELSKLMRKDCAVKYDDNLDGWTIKISQVSIKEKEFISNFIKNGWRIKI